jgi:uncharacterized membrane protein
MIVWGLVLAVHLIGVAVWIGGMAFAILVLRPALRVLEPPQRLALHAQVFRRFFLVVWHAMPLVLLSGYAMLFGIYGGFGGADWSVHVMHGLGLLMATVFVVLFFGPWGDFRREASASAKAAAVARIRLLVTINLVVGVLTIAVAALGWR